MNIVIVGCGLIGEKRLQALSPKEDRVVAFIDPNRDRASKLCEIWKKSNQLEEGPLPFLANTLDDFIKAHPEEFKKVEAAIIATINKELAPVAKLCLKNGISILIEKPGGMNFKEVQELEELQILTQNAKTMTIARVGFNHRFHPAMLAAKKLIDEGAIGEIMFIRGRYGHGGRLHMEKEWRSDPKLSGGGELLDQGCHLIDLSRWFLKGEFDLSKSSSKVGTYYWDMSVDDNAFMILETPVRDNHPHLKRGQTAFLHVSCSEWKNIFSYEIYGVKGKLIVEGLGGSYGVEKLYYYEMLKEMGPPLTTIFEYPRGDQSWKLEFEEFRLAMKRESQSDRTSQVGADLKDALNSLKIIDHLYKENGYDYNTGPT